MYFVPVLAGAFYVGRAGTLWLNGPIEVADGRGGTERAIPGDGRLKALVQPHCDVRMPGMELNSNGPYGYLAVLNFIIFFVAFVFIGIERRLVACEQHNTSLIFQLTLEFFHCRFHQRALTRMVGNRERR